MVVSRTAGVRPAPNPAIKETLNPAPRAVSTQRVPTLPSLAARFPSVCSVAPLTTTTTSTTTAAPVAPRRLRYSRSNTADDVASSTAGVRRVRFELPPTSVAAVGSRSVQVAGVESWLRSRAGVSASDSHSSSPRIHDTARYRKGTLPPTAHNTTPGTGSPGAVALLKAAKEGDEEAVCEQLRRAAQVGIPEADLNLADVSGRTAVSYIAAHGSMAMLEAILHLPGLDINKQDNEGNTPLHFAAQAGHVEVLNYILSRCTGVEVDARNNLGFTPLMKAALQGRTKCAKLLLFAGASPTLRDTGRGLRAEQWARFCGRYVCAEMIEKFARHRLLERTTAYGRWGSEPELGARLLMGGKLPQNNQNTSQLSGFKSKLRRAFRTNSSGAATDSNRQNYSLVTQLTTAALCVSTPVLPTPNVPPMVKSLIRPLTVPKLHVTLASGAESGASSTREPENTAPEQTSTTNGSVVRDRPPTARPSAVRHKKKK
ncbi:ankyrin repeat domain-containing protein 33B [Anabrus simplex]|uniref:ankyrin repeat domain-containing protein 33B n=1 Tax=Anabrus simplex TaxID=316456 RepID=UPI0035A2A502